MHDYEKIDKAIEERRRDENFMTRLKASIESNRALLDLLSQK